MAWQDTMLPMLRYLVNDITDIPTSYRYEDNQLETTMLISAQLITQFDVDFDTSYTINIPNSYISPDPTASPQDNNFINLVVLKSAMIVLQGEVQAIALQALRISDGPSSIDYTEAARAVQKRFDEMKDQYEQARLQYMAGNRGGPIVINHISEYRSPWSWTSNGREWF